MESVDYRLIWFIHFHKAGGTSIVDLAQANRERFWPRHLNGNPVDDQGQQIKLWKYSDRELRHFIDQCQNRQVTFVATEWAMPNLRVLGHDRRIKLITCLRDPLARYVSNFYFDLHHGFTPARNLRQYKDTRERTITMFNYYCRILSHIDNDPIPINKNHYERAQTAVKLFYHCAILEYGLKSLADSLDWQYSEFHSNSSGFRWRQIIGNLIRGRFNLVWLQIIRQKKSADPQFARYFKINNQFDYQLYENLVDMQKINEIETD